MKIINKFEYMNFDNLDEKLREEARVKNEIRKATDKASAKKNEGEKNDDREKAGKIAEREAFGEIDQEKYDKTLNEMLEAAGSGRSHDEKFMHRLYREAVKKTQPFEDPTRPEKKGYRFPLDLHAQIADELGVEYRQLRYYTTVGGGSDLDRKCGVDAFFELDLPGEKTIESTIDITLKDEEAAKGKWKADVIVHSWKKIPYEMDESNDSESAKVRKKENRKKWDERARYWAKEIKGVFEQKAREQNLKIGSVEEGETRHLGQQKKAELEMAIKKERQKGSLRRDRTLRKRQVA
ncbi:MAG: hypothetical protein NTW46_01310 [Candidatus Nealsonbacteria bacterium]|nr:hypothetical protein [Candidatus Nealsonbacteria bacterium]